MDVHDSLIYSGYLEKLPKILYLLRTLQSIMSKNERQAGRIMFNNEYKLFDATRKLSTSFKKLIESLLKKMHPNE